MTKGNKWTMENRKKETNKKARTQSEIQQDGPRKLCTKPFSNFINSRNRSRTHCPLLYTEEKQAANTRTAEAFKTISLQPSLNR